MGMLNKEECRRRYEAGLAEFAQPGRRDYMVTHGGFVNWGRSCGMSAEEIIEDAHNAGVFNRDGSIRSAWNTSTMRPDDGTETARTARPFRAKPKPQPPPKPKECFSVEALVGDQAEADKATGEGLMELSPYPVRDLTPQQQTITFLRSVFRQDEYAYVFREWEDEQGNGRATPGRLGVSVRRAEEWIRQAERAGEDVLDHAVPNAFSGRLGRTKDGRESLICAGAISAFRFLIVEFDHMPLAWQFAFWRAFVALPHPLARSLVAIVHSGNKSLHGLLYVGCASRDQWEASRRLIAGLFNADADPETTPHEVLRFCADGQCMKPRQGVRLPGVFRRDDSGRPTDKLQRLLFLNPLANKDVIAAPCFIGTGKYLSDYCGVCELFKTCPHRNPRALFGTTVLKGREVQCDDAL